jgi:hypothetical protein
MVHLVFLIWKLLRCNLLSLELISKNPAISPDLGIFIIAT